MLFILISHKIISFCHVNAWAFKHGNTLHQNFTRQNIPRAKRKLIPTVYYKKFQGNFTIAAHLFIASLGFAPHDSLLCRV